MPTEVSAALHDASRRTLLAGAGAAVLIALLPVAASATPDQVSAEIKKLFADRKLLDGRIKLEVPSIAENGLVVPLGFEVDSPMKDGDFVKAVHVFADGNPNPQIASFHFTALAPKAAASIRMRLAQTQKLVALAEMSNGDVYMVAKEVKVTIGGCGG